MDRDVSKQLKDDYKKYQRLKNVGSGDGFGLGAMLEYAFWTLTILSVIGMMVSMWWVGPDKPIDGKTWLVASLGCLSVFGLLALVCRQLPEV